MIYLYLFGTCFHFIYVFMIIGNKKVHLYERGDYPTEFVALQEYVRCLGDCTKLTDYSDMPDHW